VKSADGFFSDVRWSLHPMSSVAAGAINMDFDLGHHPIHLIVWFLQIAQRLESSMQAGPAISKVDLPGWGNLKERQRLSPKYGFFPCLPLSKITFRQVGFYKFNRNLYEGVYKFYRNL